MRVPPVLRRHRRLLSNAGVLVLLGLWFVTLAPTFLHGPAAYVEVSGHSMDGTYKTGDLILTRKHDTYARGDIVVFTTDTGGQVVHRIIGGDGVRGYTTQGDNNPDPDPWHPTDDEVVGKAWHRFEQKAWILHLPRQPWFAGLAAGLLTAVVLGFDSGSKDAAGKKDGRDEKPARRRRVRQPAGDDSGARVGAGALPTTAPGTRTVGVRPVRLQPAQLQPGPHVPVQRRPSSGPPADAAGRLVPTGRVTRRPPTPPPATPPGVPLAVLAATDAVGVAP